MTLEKLWFLQRAHATRLAHLQTDETQDMIIRTADAAREMYSIDRVPNGQRLEPFTRGLLQIDAKNFTTPAEFCARNAAFFTEPERLPFEQETSAIVTRAQLQDSTQRLIDTPYEEWTSAYLTSKINEITNTLNKERDQSTASGKAVSQSFYRYLRWVLFGGRTGPSLTAAMELLGKGHCMKRAQDYMDNTII